MTDIDIIDHHTIIRDTVGYEVLNEVELFDMPKVMEFLKIMYNYNRMKEHARSKSEDEDYEKYIEALEFLEKKRIQREEPDWEEQQLIDKLLSDRSYAHGFHEGAPLYKMEGMYYVLNMELDQVIRVLHKLD